MQPKNFAIHSSIFRMDTTAVDGIQAEMFSVISRWAEDTAPSVSPAMDAKFNMAFLETVSFIFFLNEWISAQIYAKNSYLCRLDVKQGRCL